MRWIRRVGVLGVALYLITVAGLALFVEKFQPNAGLPQNPVIVVLSAGQSSDGSMGPYTAERLWTGVDLFQRYGATQFVVTGGNMHEGLPGVAHAMADSARMAGVPRAKIVVEARSQSTLQNAIFTRDLLPEATGTPVVLVTNRFHLPRAWASFRWAGFQKVLVYPSDTASDHWLRLGFGHLFFEVLKTGLNALRASGASLADELGVPRDRYMPLLD